MNGDTLTSLENRILLQLLEPGKNKTEVARVLGYNHPGRVNKQINRLKKRGLITVASTYTVKGNKVQRWRLTEDGILQTIILGVSFNEISPEYQDIYKTVKAWIIIDQGLTRELGSTWKAGKGKFFQQQAAIIQASRKFGDTRLELTLSGFLADFLKNSLGISNSNIQHLAKAIKKDPGLRHLLSPYL